jgi:hypothetical protein
MVTQETINAILHYVRIRQREIGSSELRIWAKNINLGKWNSDETWKKAAEILWHENIRSVCHRYPEDYMNSYGKITYAFRLKTVPISAIQALKCLDCLEYQSCECDDFYDSEAKALIEQFRKGIVGTLPGYQEASWGLERDPRFS